MSFFLDCMAANWDGLVLNDYEAVMPLTWKKKWAIKYLYQPTFIQQGGIYFCGRLTKNIFKEFFIQLEKHFRFAEIALSHANMQMAATLDCQKKEKVNFIVPLKKNYEALHKSYLPNFTKSLRRIKKFNLQYSTSQDYTSAIEMYKEYYFKKLGSATDKDFKGLIKVCKTFNNENKLVMRQVFSVDENLLAVVILLKEAGRLYNIISCITEKGKKLEANYFLYDKIIEEFAGQQLILDMEGSDKKGIADFYEKLNPLNENYLQIKINNLPAVIKKLKP
ncbi:MAG: hypothetical protein ABIP30_04770 [Ferruginibacter sp.]